MLIAEPLHSLWRIPIGISAAWVGEITRLAVLTCLRFVAAPRYGAMLSCAIACGSQFSIQWTTYWIPKKTSAKLHGANAHPSELCKPSVFVSTGAWCAIRRAEAPSSHLTRLSLLLIPAPNLGVRLLRQSKARRQRQTRTKSSSVVLFIPRCLLPPSLHLTFPIRHSFSICQSHSLLFPPRLACRLPTGGPLVSSACFLTQLHSMLTHKTYYHAS